MECNLWDLSSDEFYNELEKAQSSADHFKTIVVFSMNTHPFHSFSLSLETSLLM